jgi:hypothetical protein
MDLHDFLRQRRHPNGARDGRAGPDREIDAIDPRRPFRQHRLPYLGFLLGGQRDRGAAAAGFGLCPAALRLSLAAARAGRLLPVLLPAVLAPVLAAFLPAILPTFLPLLLLALAGGRAVALLVALFFALLRLPALRLLALLIALLALFALRLVAALFALAALSGCLPRLASALPGSFSLLLPATLRLLLLLLLTPLLTLRLRRRTAVLAALAGGRLTDCETGPCKQGGDSRGTQD